MPYWVSLFLIVLVAYIVISVILYYLQDYLLFKPEKLSKDFEFHYQNQTIREYNLETRDGAVICVRRDEKNDRCMECGCPLAAKTRSVLSKCDIGLW